MISKLSPSKDLPDGIEVNTFIGVIDKMGKANYMTKERQEPEGWYVHYTYIGEWADYAKISRRAYLEILPKMKLKLRKGENLERVRSSTNKKIQCDHYIPISL